MRIVPRKKQTPSKFGERLAALRKQRGLTQVQLAQRIGSTQRAISYYETAVGHPPAPAVAALAKALGVTSDELLGLEPPRERPKDSPETRKLWKKFQRLRLLSTKDQRAIIRLINTCLVAARARGSAQASQ